jgi:hypothetical protein
MRFRLAWQWVLLVGTAGCVATVTRVGSDGGAPSADASIPSDGGSEADAGSRDAGTIDAGGPRDAGGRDAGSVEDAGGSDAGGRDAGHVEDAGGYDAGGDDAGGTGSSDGGYALTVTLPGSGTGTVTGAGLSCPPTCAVNASGNVTLTAAPSNGSTFIGWGGACSGTSATCHLTVSGPTSVYAIFNPPGALPGIYTWRYDNTRQGQNVSETTLTTANVNSTQFGLIATYNSDGFTYAQPLYVAGVNVPGKGIHNVVYVATEHDSVFAFDADGIDTSPLWQAIFINPPAVTTVPAGDTGETGDLIPEHGINGTPVIDPTTNTLYVVANTKESGPVYPYRLHALDLGTGAEKFGGPVVIQAASGGITFDPLAHMQRPALLLSNGILYIPFGSHGDHNTYQGWVLSYSPSGLTQIAVYNDEPSGSSGAIWQSGAGLVADGSGDIYFETANGTYDGTNLADSVVKLTSGLSVVDWFTPSDQANLEAGDYDLGSAGAILLPAAVGSATHPNLVLATGKPDYFYLLDAANMGKYQSGGNDTQIVQRVAIRAGFSPCVQCGVYNTEAFWNGGSATAGTIYVSDANDSGGTDNIRSFTISGASITAPSPAGDSVALFGYPGMGLGVSSNGTSNGILWAIEVDNYTPTSPAILHAYDATNLANHLYDTTQAANNRDQAGLAVKFTVPLVVNGKVYVAGQSSLSVYGLLP